MKRLIHCSIFFLLITGLHAQYTYIHPVEASKYNSPQTNIVLKSKFAFNTQQDFQELIELKGLNKEYEFKILFSENNHTLIIQPIKLFDRLDLVTVSIQELTMTNGTHMEAQELHFSTAAIHPGCYRKLLSDRLTELIGEKATGTTEAQTKSFFSFYTVVTNNASASQHPIFFRNNAPLNVAERMIGIVENDGNIIFSLQSQGKGMNFGLQPSGYLSYYAIAANGFKIVDSSYAEVDTKYAGNGYVADMHDFIHLPNGHYYIVIADPQQVDMSLIYPGGNPNASVIGTVVQELDENDNVIFQWRSWDHFSILDCIDCDFTDSGFEYTHINSADIDDDGNLIISNRLMSEVTKIDRSNGNIIWRLGGLNNQFNFTNDTVGFSYQHDSRRIDNGNLLLYDNGNMHAVQVSSAKEYQLDEVNHTATLVWSFTHPDTLFGKAMGGVQRLSNGNTFIGWGWVSTGEPSITEVDPAGNIVYEAVLEDLGLTYRARRYAWYPDSIMNPNAIETLEENELLVYPNPAEKYFQLMLEEEITSLDLLDINGKLMAQYIAEPGNRYFLPKISSGLYLIKVFHPQGKISCVKLLVKQ